MPCPPPCSCTCVCRDNRHCFAGTRSRLSMHMHMCMVTNNKYYTKQIANRIAHTNKCRSQRNGQSTSKHNKPLQPVAPLFFQPDGQLPHVLPPSVLLHVRLLSHPPLFFRHSFTSENKCACTHVFTTTKRISDTKHQIYRTAD